MTSYHDSALLHCISEKYKHDYPVIGELFLEELSPLQRILLSADGTLTKMLEVYLDEKIGIIKLDEQVIPAPKNIEPLDIKNGNEIIKRTILLQGKKSKQNWLYADSIIALERMEQRFREQLLNSHTPIGKLWLEHKIETFKEIISAQREPAEELGNYFHISKKDNLLSRTYIVFCRYQPVMMITEKFPECYFK